MMSYNGCGGDDDDDELQSSISLCQRTRGA